nr:MAG TPA: hypothetical protein [Microviridae sp.]
MLTLITCRGRHSYHFEHLNFIWNCAMATAAFRLIVNPHYLPRSS